MTDFDMPDAPKVSLVPKYRPLLARRALKEDIRDAKVTEIPTKVPGVRPLKIRTLSDVDPEDTRWFWYPYIPANRLSILEGDPGAGKSWITCSLAASLSSGTSLPFQAEALPPKTIIMASSEDGLADTMYPRLKQLGADLRRIHFIDDKFMLDQTGMKQLDELIERTNADALIIDPIVSYLGRKVDMHRANEVRDIMKPLAELAEKHQIAVIVVRHLRKEGANSKAGKDIYRGIGSIDFTAAARSVLQVSEDRKGTKVMVHAKSNGAPKGPSLEYAFEIKKEPMKMIDPKSGVLIVQTKWDSANFVWLGEYKGLQERPVSTQRRPQEKAIDWLKALLSNGPVLSKEVVAKAEKEGIADRTFRRAKQRFVVSEKSSDGEWYMRLATPHELKEGRMTAEILEKEEPYVIPEGTATFVPTRRQGKVPIDRAKLPGHLRDILDKVRAEEEKNG